MYVVCPCLPEPNVCLVLSCSFRCLINDVVKTCSTHGNNCRCSGHLLRCCDLPSLSGKCVGSEPSLSPGCTGQVAWDLKFRVLVKELEFPLAFAPTVTRTDQIVCVRKIIVVAFKSSDWCASVCLVYSIQSIRVAFCCGLFLANHSVVTFPFLQD